jgi:hypothetical protein
LEKPVGLHHAPSAFTSLPVPLREQPCLNDTDGDLFHHAQFFIIHYLADLSDSADFWYRYAMPISHAITPLQFVICALGAAHRHFLSSGPAGCTTIDNAIQLTEVAAIEKYNEAIAHIKAYTSACVSHLDTNCKIIMCCLIFVTIENLLGRHEQSVQHLQAGTGLLATSTFSSLPNQNSELKNALLRVFYQLGKDAAIYGGHDTLGDMVHLIPPPDLGSRYEPFKSDEEAWGLLLGLVVVYDSAMASFAHVAKARSFGDPEPNVVAGEQFPSNEQAALSKTREAFKVWDQRYELFQKAMNNIQSQHRDEYRVNLISLHHAIWVTLVKMSTFSDHVPIEDYIKILSRVEKIGPSWRPQANPTFGLGGDLVPVLAFVCASCEDQEVRTRSIAMLRSLRKREGF